jgi:hypothetical protein
VIGEEDPLNTCPVSTTVTIYDVIAEPFGLAPENDTRAARLSGTAVTIVGAVGKPAGVNVTGDEPSDTPAAFIARTIAV